jgi:hypothetical protein
MLGSIKRSVNFGEFNLAQNLMEKSYLELADYVMNQNVTGQYEINNEYWMDATESESTGADIALTIKIPAQQEFRVRMNLLVTFKLAYIQYLSFFLVCYYVVYCLLLDYAFSQNILESTTSSELAGFIRKQKN